MPEHACGAAPGITSACSRIQYNEQSVLSLDGFRRRPPRKFTIAIAQFFPSSESKKATLFSLRINAFRRK
jgi:hypothetical protein